MRSSAWASHKKTGPVLVASWTSFSTKWIIEISEQELNTCIMKDNLKYFFLIKPSGYTFSMIIALIIYLLYFLQCD